VFLSIIWLVEFDMYDGEKKPMTISAKEVYDKHIKDLPIDVRLRLLEMTAHDLARAGIEDSQKRSLMELEGLGAEIWQGIDAQEYVNALRQEWNDRR
jgi:hypothetical protein